MEECPTSVFSDCKFNYNLPDGWKRKAEEELNENPETVLQEISVFREKVKGIPGLQSRLDDCFLLSFLRAFMFNQEDALEQVQKFYAFRKAYPEYFDPLLVSENKELYFDLKLFKILPERDSNGRTILINKLGACDFSHLTIEQLWRAVFTILDCLLFDETFQIGGLLIINDVTNIGLSHLRQVTYKYIKVFTQVMLSTYPVHFKEVHVLNPPFYFHLAFGLIKPFLSEKIMDKIFIHGSDLTSASRQIEPSEILPVTYGGTEPGFDDDWFLNKMLDMEHALKEHAKYGYQSTDST